MIKTLKFTVNENDVVDITFERFYNQQNNYTEFNFDIDLNKIKRALKMNFKEYSFDVLEDSTGSFFLSINNIVIDSNNKEGNVVKSFLLNNSIIDKLKKLIYKLN